MVITRVQRSITLFQFKLGQTLHIRTVKAPANLNFSFCTKELNSIELPPVCMVHDHPVLILHLHSSFGPVLGRNKLHRSGLVHTKGPLRNIEHVSAPVGDHPTAKTTVVPPVGISVELD